MVDLGDHVNMKVGGLMRKQRNVPGRIFDFPYLVSLQGKRLAWALEVDQRINTNGLPLKRYVLTLTFFFLKDRGVGQSFSFDFGLSLYQSYCTIWQIARGKASRARNYTR